MKNVINKLDPMTKLWAEVSAGYVAFIGVFLAIVCIFN